MWRRPSRRRGASLTSDTTGLEREPTLDGVHDFLDRDVQQTHAILGAPAEMMTTADGVARDGDVARGKRSISRRPRRPVDADERGADGRCDVCGTGIARDHE